MTATFTPQTSAATPIGTCTLTSSTFTFTSPPVTIGCAFAGATRATPPAPSTATPPGTGQWIGCVGVLLSSRPLGGPRTLRDIAEMARLRGARTVVVGIQPDVAFVIVRLGLDTGSLVTALDLEEGLEYLGVRTAPSSGRVR